MSTNNPTAQGAETPRPFMPDAPRAGAIDLAAAIKQSRDKSQTKTKEDELGLTAEVLVPGLPNGAGGYGLVCGVKKFTGFDAGQIVYKCRQEPEIDDPMLYKNAGELSSADARSGWWRDTWRLIYGCTDETKRVLAAIATGRADATPAMFGVDEAQYWLKCKESVLVSEPLLQAIVILNYYAKDKVKTSSELDDFKALPDTLEQLQVAYRAGALKEWMAGNPEVVGFIVENVKLLMELMDMVDDTRDRRQAVYFKEAAQQAVREVINEYFGKELPSPRPEAELFKEEAARLLPQEESDLARAAHGGGPKMELVTASQTQNNAQTAPGPEDKSPLGFAD
jgi:hypothetical protein